MKKIIVAVSCMVAAVCASENNEHYINAVDGLWNGVKSSCDLADFDKDKYVMAFAEGCDEAMEKVNEIMKNMCSNDKDKGNCVGIIDWLHDCLQIVDNAEREEDFFGEDYGVWMHGRCVLGISHDIESEIEERISYVLENRENIEKCEAGYIDVVKNYDKRKVGELLGEVKNCMCRCCGSVDFFGQHYTTTSYHGCYGEENKRVLKAWLDSILHYDVLLLRGMIKHLEKLSAANVGNSEQVGQGNVQDCMECVDSTESGQIRNAEMLRRGEEKSSESEEYTSEDGCEVCLMIGVE